MAKNVKNSTYLSVSILGNNFKLNIKYKSNFGINLEQKENEIDLFLPKVYKNSDNIDVVNLAIQKLYDKIAETELEYSMEIARHLLKFAPEDYKIERLNKGFYKCLKNKVLIINPDIFQYNRDIINTTIIQAFCKIKYKSNSNIYSKTLQNAIFEYQTSKNNYSVKKSLMVS